MSKVPQQSGGDARDVFRRLAAAMRRMSWRWAAMHSMERALANGEDEPGEATIRHEWSVARDAAVDAIQAVVPHVEQAQRESHRLVALASELRMMSDAGTLADMRRWLAKFEGEAASLRHAFALAHHDAPAHQVGTDTLSHLRAVLNVQTQVRYPQATRGLEELREQLVPSDREALDRELAAKKAVEDAKLVVGANNDGMLQVDGPIIEALCAAGLASRVAGAVRYSGRKSKRAQVIATERKKLHAALEAARHAIAASPRPEQAIREAASSMLPLLRELLGQLREVLRMHGNLIARPLDQDEPRYGPTVGSHPPHYWPGTSGHDVVTQLAAAVLETLDSGNDPDMVLHDDEFERLRRDVEREAGELQRRAQASSSTTSALNQLSVEGQTGDAANVPHEDEDDAATPPGFFRDGGGWTIEFENKRAIVKHLTGMAYIQKLLSSPGVPIAAASFERPTKSVDSEQVLVDDQGIGNLRKAMMEVDDDIAEAKEHGREAGLEDLYRKKQTIDDQMRQSMFRGRKRTMKSPTSAVADNVRAAIRRSMRAIAAQHKALGEHLERAIRGRGSANPVYDPRPPITWRVNT